MTEKEYMTCIFDAGVTQIHPSDSLIQNFPVNILESSPYIYARKMIATSKNRNWALEPLMIAHHVGSLSDWNSLEILAAEGSPFPARVKTSDQDIVQT